MVDIHCGSLSIICRGYYSTPKSLIDHLMTKYYVFDFRVLLLEIVSGNKNLDHHEDLDLVTWVS
jgi:hypothetical protein